MFLKIKCYVYNIFVNISFKQKKLNFFINLLVQKNTLHFTLFLIYKYHKYFNLILI